VGNFDVNSQLSKDIEKIIIQQELASLRQFTWNWLVKALKDSSIL
jgi:hypothetical protein